ncbi:MAG: response regulator [Polyangiaceae bacterium]|jgi:CheY-like chemotaxis protein|nr:response regulator [Polyangiaceae bacterium]
MTIPLNRRVLFVDDEPNVLSALTRNLGGSFEITTADSGPRALDQIASAPSPFAVIVSDMRMPTMDGAAFLAKAKELAPTSTRLLLTGDADVKSAMKAVNEGHIFRFLCKPCPSEVLGAAVQAAAEQHALVIAERDIMERTLSAVVKTLGDVLSLAEPELFKRATVVKSYVSYVVQQLGMEGAWQIEVAASIHTLGLIALPRDLAHSSVNQAPLTVEDKKQLATHPETARRILEAIPRLEDVALIVAQQAEEPEQGPDWVKRGARLLRLCKRVDSRVTRGSSLGEAVDSLLASVGPEEQTYLEALKAMYSGQMECRELRFRDLMPLMVLEADVKTRDGALVLPKGHELSAVLIERLRQFAASRRVDEPIRVRIPPPKRLRPGP